jgi:integral membrane protein (TIGR01906 family)
METHTPITQARCRLYITTALGWLLVVGVPVWMLLSSTRLLMTEAYLRFEYGKLDFPADPFGLTQDERREYAPYAVNYLLNDRDIHYLADLTFPDGTPMYNQRELRHMADVKVVTQTALGIYTLLSIFLLAAAAWLYRSPSTRRVLRQSLIYGGYATAGIMAALMIIIVLKWDFFFDSFHQFFFESGTWRFEYSDTLIRLFPERFWFDAAITVGVLTLTGELLLAALAWAWERKAKAAAAPQETAAPEPK